MEMIFALKLKGQLGLQKYIWGEAFQKKDGMSKCPGQETALHTKRTTHNSVVLKYDV